MHQPEKLEFSVRLCLIGMSGKVSTTSIPKYECARIVPIDTLMWMEAVKVHETSAIYKELQATREC